MLSVGTMEDVLSIGAYLSPSLADSGESLREDLPEGIPYYFTSVGPTPDGAIGPNFAAPGECLTSLVSFSIHNCKQTSENCMEQSESPFACCGA